MGNGEKATNRRKHGSHLAPRDELWAGAFTKTFGSFDDLRLGGAPCSSRGARWLLYFAPETRLVGSEPRFERVLGDVVTQAAKLAFVAHEVIKGVLLPKAALGAKTTIDLPGREMLPRIALHDHRGFVGESGEQMDVVRHDDEIEHLVSFAIEVQKAVGDDIRDFWLAEHAGTMAGIERFMPARGEAVVVFDHQVGWKFLDQHLPAFLGGIDAVEVEPAIAIRPPAFKDILRHGIRRAPSDEDHGAVLGPMRQLALGDEQFVVRVEETHA